MHAMRGRTRRLCPEEESAPSRRIQGGLGSCRVSLPSTPLRQALPRPPCQVRGCARRRARKESRQEAALRRSFLSRPTGSEGLWLHPANRVGPLKRGSYPYDLQRARATGCGKRGSCGVFGGRGEPNARRRCSAGFGGLVRCWQADEPRPGPGYHGLNPRVHPQVREQVGDVVAHRGLAEDELVGDLGRRLSLREKLEDLEFRARTKAIEALAGSVAEKIKGLGAGSTAPSGAVPG